MGMSHVKVRIDRIVLKGFEAADARALVEGLKSELSEMLADRAKRTDWVCSYHRPVLRLGQMSLGPGASGGRNFGNGLARAIGKGLKL
jgi:hypothetical protein